MKQEELMKLKNWRKIKPNEIVIEIDNPEISWEEIHQTAFSLGLFGYNIRLFYAKGQRSPHLHIEINGLEDLPDNLRQKYKELFIKKYSPKADLCMADNNRLIAEENKLHFKYKTPKLMIGLWNEKNKNEIEPELLEQAKQETKPQERKGNAKGSGITAEIIKKLSIIEVAKSYGLPVDSHGKCLCPFHADNKTPSLKFYDSEGRFCCFGCQKKGNIVYFTALMEKLKNGRAN